jgi:fructose-bisphosphate aldolase class I
LGIPQTEEARRAYRELIVTTPGLGECIGGAILYDETTRQKKRDGTPFVQALIEAGIIPGIKVDTGAKELAGHPGEKVTEGLDGLRDRLVEYSRLGARFAKWRAVIAIGEGIPSRGCIGANAQALARYAALARKPDWFQSSSLKSLWTATIVWSAASRSPREFCEVFSASFIHNG